ncbi:MAG: zinc ribbon domain-containing protein [Brevefilum sp.]|nr:zinc ribbon domain-containing protein [Brevefilum sp.]MDT8382718.1 zinc ribbon domain-containing protein [Brevefilum sp.]
MPIYEYTCQDCNANFEMIRSMKDADASLNCTNCQSQNVKRRISLFNASSAGRTIAGSSTCSGCAGGTCATCGTY